MAKLKENQVGEEIAKTNFAALPEESNRKSSEQEKEGEDNKNAAGEENNVGNDKNDVSVQNENKSSVAASEDPSVVPEEKLNIEKTKKIVDLEKTHLQWSK